MKSVSMLMLVMGWTLLFVVAACGGGGGDFDETCEATCEACAGPAGLPANDFDDCSDECTNEIDDNQDCERALNAFADCLEAEGSACVPVDDECLTEFLAYGDACEHF